MQIHYDRSKLKSAIPDGEDDLLYRRAAMLGLDVDAIGRDYSEIFNNIKRNYTGCSTGDPSAVTVGRDPNSRVWETYCRDPAAFNALVALIEVIH